MVTPNGSKMRPNAAEVFVGHPRSAKKRSTKTSALLALTSSSTTGKSSTQWPEMMRRPRSKSTHNALAIQTKKWTLQVLPKGIASCSKKAARPKLGSHAATMARQASLGERASCL